MAKPNFTLPNKPAIKSDSILSYNYTDDFTFVPAPLAFNRDSAATRVNEKGLIEDVGYFGPELVKNGGFNELGPELVVNGDFNISGGEGATKWSGYNNVWHIQGGKADCDGNTSFTNNVSPDPIQAEESYRTEMTISNYQSGAVAVRTGGGMSSDEFSRSNGTHVFYGVSGNYDSRVYLDPLPSFKGSVDNVSVKSLNPNNYWSLQHPTLTQIKADGLHFINAAYTPCYQLNVFTVGKKYRITVNLSLTSGSFKLPHQDGVSSGSATVNTPVTNATYQYDITAVVPPSPYTAHRMRFWGDNSCNAVIHSMSVVEILGGKPRIDYSDSLTEPSLLLEPQSTNLITYSEDIGSNGFSTINSSIQSNVTTSPDGTLNADLLKENTANNSHFMYKDFNLSSGQTYTISVFAKSNGVNRNLRLGDGGVGWSNDFDSDFDLTNGTASNGGVIQSYGNGWYRCSVVGTTNAATSRLLIYSTLNSYTTYQGDGASGVFLYGLQIENLPYATSYIPTTGATATRLGETAVDAGDVNVFNSEEGVLFFEGSALSDGTNQRWITIGSGSNANRVSIHFNATNRISCSVRGSSSAIYDADFNIGSQTNNTKAAIKYKDSDYAFFVNGVKVDSQQSGSLSFNASLSEFSFDSADDSSPFYGKVKNVQVFNKALTDKELEILTIQ